MLPLPNGCRVGKISVSPANWDEPGASTKKDWYIHYRFHHPDYKEKYKKGYLKILKGMNDEKSLSGRRSITRGLIKNEMAKLERGYSPIVNDMIESPATSEFEIPSSTPFIPALQQAYNLLPNSKSKKEVRKALEHIKPAIRQCRYDILAIGDIRQKHIKAILGTVGHNKKKAYLEENAGKLTDEQIKQYEWGAASYNHYRSYLKMLFTELKQAEATEVDPVTEIKKKKVIKRLKEVLSAEEVKVIDTKIKESFYTFWRFIYIFERSGARMAEMMLVKREDVYLSIQKFKIIIRKGQQQEEVLKTITDAALPLWKEVMSEGVRVKVKREGCRAAPGSRRSFKFINLDPAPGDYLFSEDLRPGHVAINESQVTRRWCKYVKKGLGIKSDFYKLKHKYSTEVVSAAMKKIDEATKVAAEHNSHKGTAMVRKHYDLERSEREHEELKKIDISLN